MPNQKRAKRKADELNEQVATLIEAGAFEDAMKMCVRSLRADETADARALFVRLITSPGTSWDRAAVRPCLVRALSAPWCRTGQLVPASFAAIRSNPVVGRCIDRAQAAWPTPLSGAELFGADGLAALAADDLLRAVLESTPAAGLDFEHFLTLARRALLLDAVDAPAPEAVDAARLQFSCSLARQCHINEYVYDVTGEEREGVARLRDGIASALSERHAVPGLWLALLGCYEPLSSLPGCEQLADSMTEPPLLGVYAQQIREPLVEQRYRGTLRRATPIDDGISTAVRRQYEEHPYPRWTGSPPVEPLPFSRFVTGELGLDSPPLARRDKVDILIAGCGTGQQSIQTARRFPLAKILALDLSAASLAYAERKTRELRVNNVEHVQGDLLRLDAIVRTFDYIECVGVLHHLDDPVAGWRMLRSRLRPGGVMRIGLYSELARRDIAAAQRRIAAEGYEPTTDGIRRFRRDLQLSEGWRAFRSLAALEDFYDTSGCRDLLFHVREHRFTLPQIKAILAELELAFVRFNIDADVLDRYAQRYPGELARADLNCWTQFELEHPHTFIGMYNFYVHASA